MERDTQQRLEAALHGDDWRPFAVEDQDIIERKLGRPIPQAVRYLWSTFGGGTIPSSSVYFYDAEEVIDLVAQYRDHGLADLLPLATDGGSQDFAIDLTGRRGHPAGTILLNGRGTMLETSLEVIAQDLIGLVELARTDSRWA